MTKKQKNLKLPRTIFVKIETPLNSAGKINPDDAYYVGDDELENLIIEVGVKTEIGKYRLVKVVNAKAVVRTKRAEGK